MQRLLTIVSLGWLLVQSPVMAMDGMDMPMMEDIDITSQAGPEENNEENAQPGWLDKLRWSANYLGQAPMTDSAALDNHRLDLRARLEHLVYPNLYFQADAKVVLHSTLDQTSDDRETDTDLRAREFSLQFSQQHYSLKAGYQILVWGEMDAVQISDVMSPWDYSEFAFTSPEDARVGQPMLIADWFSDVGKWQLVYTPMALINRYPDGDTGALIGYLLGTNQFVIDEQKPEAVADYELGLRWRYSFTGSDVSLMLASLVSDNPNFELKSVDANDRPNFRVTYPRYTMVAVTANRVSGNFLYKFEAAFKQGLYFPGTQPLTRDTIETALGVDYNANGAYNLTVEVSNQHINDGTGELIGVHQDNLQWLARWSKGFFHDTLNAVYYLSNNLQTDDLIQSGNLAYAISDFWHIDFNLTRFDIGDPDSPLRFADDWDQASLRLGVDW